MITESPGPGCRGGAKTGKVSGVVPDEIRSRIEGIQWTPELVDRLIRGMPKVETHLHLDGSLSPRTIMLLAQRQGYGPLAGKSEEEIGKLTMVDKPRSSLAEVLAAFHAVYPLLHDYEAIERIAYEAAVAAAGRNVRYLEARFAPALNTAAEFSMERVLQAALSGLARAEEDHGVKSGVIVCLIRPFSHVSRERNAEMAELAVRYKGRGVVALDLAGDESAQPLSEFRDLFEKAKAAGLGLTAHAGEAPGSRDLETVLELGLDRVGHAILLGRDPELLREFRARGIAVEVNLTSNLRTAAVADLASHPVKAWYAAGVPVALSTDDPGVFGIDIDHEYRLLARALGFSALEIVDVSLQGIDALFLSEERKQDLRERFRAELTAVLKGLHSALMA